MKQVYLRGVIFIFSSTLSLAIISVFFKHGVRHSDNAQTGKINLIMSHKIKSQISIFGSSVAEKGLNPNLIFRTTGLSCYNFAIDGTRFLQYNGLIREFNSFDTTAGFVIIDDTFYMMEDINTIYKIDRFAPYLHNDNIYNSLYDIDPDLVRKSKYIPFYDFTLFTDAFYKNMWIGWKELIKNKSYTDSFKGFTPNFQSWLKSADEYNKSKIKNYVKIGFKSLYNLKKTINALNINNKKTILILSPIQIDGQETIIGLEKLKSLFRSLQNDHIFFIDGTALNICYRKDYFYNNAHLNNLGATVFSKYIGMKINEINAQIKPKNSN